MNKLTTLIASAAIALAGAYPASAREAMSKEEIAKLPQDKVQIIKRNSEAQWGAQSRRKLS